MGINLILLKRKIFKNFIYLSPVYIFLSLLQIPFLSNPVVHHDNTRYFFGSFSELTKSSLTLSSCGYDTQFLWLMRIGRPLSPILECANYKYIKTLQI